MIIASEIPTLLTERADGWPGRNQMSRGIVNLRSVAIQNEMLILTRHVRSIVSKPDDDMGNRGIRTGGAPDKE